MCSFAGLRALGGMAGVGGRGTSGAEPLAEGGVKCSGEVLVLKPRRWVETRGLKHPEDLSAFWLVPTSLPSLVAGRAEEFIVAWGSPLPPCVVTSSVLELGLPWGFRKRQRREGKHCWECWIPHIVAGFMSAGDKADALKTFVCIDRCTPTVCA